MRGIDSSYLVQVAVAEVPGHARARAYAEQTVFGREAAVCCAPQVLSEFVHVVTDPRRFANPMPMEEAIRRASLWWEGLEVRHVFPTAETARLFLQWMDGTGVGRNRVLDAQLAATYVGNGVTEILTTNARDFASFPGLTPVNPAAGSTGDRPPQ